MSKVVIGAISAAALSLYGCGGGSDDKTTASPAPKESIAELATSSNLTVLVTALKAADLASTFANASAGPFTVFAPTDEAFGELGDIVTCLVEPANKDILAKLLEFHVHSGEVVSSALTNDEKVTTLLESEDLTVSVDGTSVTINPGNASVVAADNMASNGVVHVVDSVLVPIDFDLGDCAPPAPTPTPPAPSQTIAELADASGLKTLVAALTAADLASTFADAKSGPFTVFAPTDDAFSALNTPELNLVECLVKPANKDVLTSVLEFHVHSGAVLSTELTNGMDVSTLLKGEDLTVTIDGDSVMINPGNATVVMADAGATNGVVHVIDHVLVPASFAVPDNCNSKAVLV